jgi:hypothetical protein
MRNPLNNDIGETFLNIILLTAMKYPYIPKSNLKILKGEYWSLSLDNGSFAFYVVLDV